MIEQRETSNVKSETVCLTFDFSLFKYYPSNFLTYATCPR